MGYSITKSFIGEQFFDRAIESEDDAADAVESVYERIGADDSVTLELETVYPTEDDTYYVYTQRVGDVRVQGAAVKLAVNKDKKVTGLVSAVMPNVKVADLDTWAVTQEQAEDVVAKELKEGGHEVAIINGASERVLIPLEDMVGRYRYAWAVYSENFDGDSEQAYLANYVNEDGDYLYSLPVSAPHSTEALAGQAVTFPFDKMEKDTWTGTATLHDGTKKDLEVPVMVDPESGDVVMGDLDRKILCADFAKYTYEDKIVARTFDDGAIDNDELLEYAAFIRIWDFYDSVGWTGPDGQSTPSLLLMDMVDENGQPIDNAAYRGKKQGWQEFAFNRITPDGEDVDIMAHEFTHCVTGTTMTSLQYQNDMGAINEGMSDIMGNLVEMLDGGSSEDAWLIGAGAGENRIMRSMINPVEYMQPARVWDSFYVPSVITPTETNDCGGVHINSSLLSVISYKLDQAGMAPTDQFYYWMNVALAMTPSTDFAQMVDLLPWCMEQVGGTEYVDAVKSAMSEIGYADREFTDKMPEGAGLLELEYPDVETAINGGVVLAIVNAANDREAQTWPMVDTNKAECFVPEGDYRLAIEIADEEGKGTLYRYIGGKWVAHEGLTDAEITDPSNQVHITSGQVLEVSPEGIPAAA